MKIPQFNPLGAGQSVNFNVTTYFQANTAGTEAARGLTVYKAGTLSDFTVLISANTIATSATTMRTRIASGNGNQSVSIAAGATGVFQDTANTDALSGAGQLVAFQIVTPNTSGAITVRAASYAFDAALATVLYRRRDGSQNSNNISLGGSLAGGVFRSINAGFENRCSVPFEFGGTLSKMITIINTNPRTTATVFRTRIDSNNGNLVYTVGAGATGTFSDTTNTDTVVATDLVNVAADFGASAELLSMNVAQAVEFQATSGGVAMIIGGFQTSTANANTTYYSGLAGCLALGASEALYQQPAMVAGKYSKLRCTIHANTVSATSTLTFRKGGGNGEQSVSITASTTGTFQDTTKADTVAATDLVDLQLVCGATGTSLNIETISMLFTAVSPEVPGVYSFIPKNLRNNVMR